MIKSAIRREGTSFLEFERKFPDSRACLDHLFTEKYGASSNCPNCDQLTKFLRARSGNHFVAQCCYDAKVYPLQGTIFSRSNLPLLKWFRCILYFTNSSSGVSADFVKCQLGISRKAAIRMAGLIRRHLAGCDCGIMLGTEGRTIFIDATTINCISRRGKKNGVKFRILAATDGHEFVAIPVASGRFASSRKLLFDRCSAGAKLEVRSLQIRRKLSDYRFIKKIQGHELEISEDPERLEFYDLAAFLVALKRFILPMHIWISERQLEYYIGHFAFLYRRRARGRDAFWDAIGDCRSWSETEPSAAE